MKPQLPEMAKFAEATETRTKALRKRESDQQIGHHRHEIKEAIKVRMQSAAMEGPPPFLCFGNAATCTR